MAEEMSSRSILPVKRGKLFRLRFAPDQLESLMNAFPTLALIVIIALAGARCAAAEDGLWSPLAVPPDRVKTLIEQEDQIDQVCQGVNVGRLTDRACELRDAYSQEIEKSGWCYGESYQIEADMIWHPCHH